MRRIAQTPLAPALVSLILTGVVGQSQHAAQLIDPQKFIYFEFGATSQDNLCDQFPILKCLKEKIWCGDPAQGHAHKDRDDDCRHFSELLEQASNSIGSVRDADVQNALRKMFRGTGRANVLGLAG